MIFIKAIKTFCMLYFFILYILFCDWAGPTKVAAWGKVAPARGMSLALK